MCRVNENKYEIEPLQALAFDRWNIYLGYLIKRRAKLADIIRQRRYF